MYLSTGYSAEPLTFHFEMIGTNCVVTQQQLWKYHINPNHPETWEPVIHIVLAFIYVAIQKKFLRFVLRLVLFVLQTLIHIWIVFWKIWQPWSILDPSLALLAKGILNKTCHWQLAHACPIASFQWFGIHSNCNVGLGPKYVLHGITVCYCTLYREEVILRWRSDF